MTRSRARKLQRIRIALVFLLGAAMPAQLLAQQDAAAEPQAPPAQTPPSQAPAPAPPEAAGSSAEKPPKPPEAPKPRVHRFWDQTNSYLFAGVLGARYLDFASTLNARRRGLDEALLNNETVDNHAAFAVIEFAGAATSVGVSYLFHRYGHHSLERWTSIIHISVATFGAGRNFLLKTPHPAPPPGG